MVLKKIVVTVILLFASYLITNAQNKIVVFQSDFGLKDGAVSAMKGVELGVSPDLKLYDLTHEILHIIFGKQLTALSKQFVTGLLELYLFQ
jgi:Zn-dependent peptidase ImmA (M78 family)